MADISIIIPTLNEDSVLGETLYCLQSLQHKDVEIIVVDGGSVDATLSIAKQFKVRTIQVEAGRAKQLNKGAELAKAEVLVFLHADTLLPESALSELLKWDKGAFFWGRFKVRLDSHRPIFRLIETMMNIRSSVTSIVTGDHAMFVSKPLFKEVGGFPCIELMEDIAISKKLKKQVRLINSRNVVITSSRRWREHGVIRTIFLMWRLRLAFYLKVNPSDLAKQYRYAAKAHQ
jgi:rSAM/selenodomain-associated transferase 2